MGSSWVSAVDAQTGRPYLFHEGTRETKWLWNQEQDPVSGKVLYRNGLTGEIRWEEKDGGKITGKKAEALRKKHKLVLEEDLYSNGNGKLYAFNRKTRKSRWLKVAGEGKKGKQEKAVQKIGAVARTFLIQNRLRRPGSSVLKIEELREKYRLEKLKQWIREMERKHFSEKDRALFKQNELKLNSYSEMITQELLKVDEIMAGQNQLIRQRRKSAVSKLLAYADEVDALKKQLSPLRKK